MKSALPFFALLLLFASCTTAYKSGQTPDDVYYSPARPQAEYVARNDRDDRYQNGRQDDYRYDEQGEDDRYLRMKVRNRRTWSDLDYYYSDPYAYNYNYRNRFNSYGNVYYNTPWDYYSSWNYYYNPYNNYYNPYYNPYGGTNVIVVNPKQPVYNRPRSFNLNVYNPPASNAYDSKNPSRRVYRGDNRSYDYNSNNSRYNANSDKGSGLRNIFNNSNSNSSTQSTVPSRSEQRPSNNSSTTPSSSPSRSSGSTNAPVRRF